MRGLVARHRFGLAVGALVLAILGVAAFLLVVAVPDVTRPGDGRSVAAASAAAAPSATSEPSARSAMGLSPIGVEMPPGSDCGACHVTAAGSVGTKPIPAMAHPLQGWQDCTACHAPARLVTTAPGHSGLHRDDCLVCHQPPDAAAAASPPPLRPEHMGTDKPCTACHGVDQHAPLPEDMKGRDNCWICHNGPEFRYLFESPSPSPGSAGGS